MKKYYYNVNDNVWGAWGDSELKAWLVEHNVIKSDAQLTRDKLIKLMQYVFSAWHLVILLNLGRENYANAADTIWGAWSDSDMRAWLIERGYLKSDAQVKRDELVKLMNNKYATPRPRLSLLLGSDDSDQVQRCIGSHGLVPCMARCTLEGVPQGEGHWGGRIAHWSSRFIA